MDAEREIPQKVKDAYNAYLNSEENEHSVRDPQTDHEHLQNAAVKDQLYKAFLSSCAEAGYTQRDLPAIKDQITN